MPVTLSNPSGQTVTVDWSTLFVPGAPDGQADPVSDYLPASGTITFSPGTTTGAATIQINADTLAEPDEYVVLTFNHPTNASMGGYWGLGFGSIVNND